MHLAINDHELPPNSLKSINLLEDGLSFTRGETKFDIERVVIREIISNLKNGDVVEYSLRASNGRLAEGRARIGRITLGGMRWPTYEITIYAFELEPIKPAS